MAKTKVTPQKAPLKEETPAAAGGNETPKTATKKKSAGRKSMAAKATSETGLSQDEKARLLTRSFRFLSTLSLRPIIRTHLNIEAGYTEEIHDDGWDKLNKAATFRKKKTASPVSEAHETAIAILDAWDEPNFARAEAALEFQFPDQYEYIFDDLKAAQGIEAIRTVETFLNRVDALDKGSDPTRSTSRKKDKEAVQRLTERKIISPEVREHLRNQIATAKSATFDTSIAPTEIESAKEQESAFRELAVWYAEWSRAARAILKKRSYLISLGLASRRSRKEVDDTEDDSDVDNDSEPSEPPQQT